MKKEFKDTQFGRFLQKVAPAAISAVGDAFPPVKFLKELLSDEDLSPADQIELEKYLKEYELEELRLALKDRDSARNMQVEALKQADKLSKQFIYWLAAGSLLIGFSYIFLITFADIPPANQRFADTILGVVITAVITTIYQFFFGASDKNKDIKPKKSQI